MIMEQEFISTAQAAKIFGISRIAILKRIKAGTLKAHKIGRNYVIRRADLPILQGGELTSDKKEIINDAIKKTFQDYGEALKLLGKE